MRADCTAALRVATRNSCCSIEFFKASIPVYPVRSLRCREAVKTRDWSVSIRCARRLVRWNRVAKRAEGRVEGLTGSSLGGGRPCCIGFSLVRTKDEELGVACISVSGFIAGSLGVLGSSFSLASARLSFVSSILLFVSSICLSIPFWSAKHRT